MTARTSDGFVYLVVNEHFPGWIKVGHTTNPSRRLNTYQTGDPTRSYRMVVTVASAHSGHAEYLSHRALRRQGFERAGEWFRVPLHEAVAALHRCADEADRLVLPAPTGQPLEVQ